jgi:hypothetical protein
MEYELCHCCYEMHKQLCLICKDCDYCCQCAKTTAEFYSRSNFYDRLFKDMEVVAKVQPRGTKDIDRNTAFKLYISGLLRRETPFELYEECPEPGLYLWCSRDYERLHWCLISGSTNEVSGV